MAVNRIESYRIAAAWYAWGQVDQAREYTKRARDLGYDESEISSPTWVDQVNVFEFANRVEAAVRAYDAGDSSALSSIQDEFRKYVEI